MDTYKGLLGSTIGNFAPTPRGNLGGLASLSPHKKRTQIFNLHDIAAARDRAQTPQPPQPKQPAQSKQRIL